MNALNQAFIKAFAKDRAPVPLEQPVSGVSSHEQLPVAGVESEALVLRDWWREGRRLRVDLPAADAHTFSPHLQPPQVQQVASYDVQDITQPTVPAVVFEDHLAPLDTASLADRAARPSCSAVRRRESAAGGEEMESRHGETLAERAAAPDPTYEQCQPWQVVAAPCLPAPEFLTRELGVLIVDADVPPAHATSLWQVALPTAGSACWPDSHEEPVAAPAARQVDRPAAPSIVPEPAVPPLQEAAFADESTLIDDSELAAVVPQTPSEEVSPAPVPRDFTPAWEVDAFRWPVLCSHWDEQTVGRVTQSGQELNVATKDGLRVLAVTSSRRTEGRTSVTLALARAAAQAGCRVALVDADSGQPELARRLGVEAPCDWRGVLRRGEPLQEAAVASLADRVTLIPQTEPETDQPRMVDVPLIRLLSDLRERFDLVIVDMGPLGESPRPIEAVLPCPVDMALVIRNVTETPREESLAAVSALRAWGVRAVGVIENFVGKDELSAVHGQES